jgi:hypothetical protein
MNEPRPTISIGPSRSGDECHQCNGGRLYCYAGRDCGSMRVKYLRCDRCAAKPENNTVYVPIEFIARRRKKTLKCVLNNVHVALDSQSGQ